MLVGAVAFCAFVVLCLNNNMQFFKEPLKFSYRHFSKVIILFVYGIALILGYQSAGVMAVRLFDFGTLQIFSVAIGLCIMILVVPLQKFLKKRMDMNIFNNRSMHFMPICAGAILAFIYIRYVIPDTYFTLGQHTVSFEDIANSLFLVSSIVMFVAVLRYISKEAVLKNEKLLIEASNKYIHDLEESYNALRTLKHDYINVLSSFKLYIDSRDIDGLTTYYYEEISEMSRDLLHQDKLMGSLQNVQPNEIKSVLIYKCSVAAEHGVDISIEVREPIEKLGVSTAVVCQIIGILLDNAIEAIAEVEKRELRIAIVKNPNSKAFIIKNTWKEKDVPLNKLSELGFSTKGENRGVGLHTVRNYTEKMKGLYLETEITDDYFCQILTVKDE